MIKLRNLSKTYREGSARRVVLYEVDADIASGETVVLLGRSGSGKTTLLNLISGIDLPTTGSVRVGDIDVTHLSERERTVFRRRNIGFIFQSFNLISTLTVIENVLLPLELSGRTEATARERAMGLLADVGLEDRAGSFPDRLSGGEQQRVTIARALAHEPMLILADEPTGNLDYETGREVMDLMGSLVEENRHTLLIATHDRELIERADRVLQIQSGKLESVSRDERINL